MNYSHRLKPGLVAIFLVVLVFLNVKKYASEGESEQAMAEQYRKVPEMVIPPILMDGSDENFSRDIFTRPEIEKEIPEDERTNTASDDTEAPVESVVKDIAEIGSYKDMDLLGVSMRSGASMALIKYDNRTYFVAAGDVVGGRYFIERIDKSGVYVSTK